jgi:nondiscriminating aspartyl-tRNA synthetase
MERIYIKDVSAHVGEEINIKGFVHVLRDQNKIVFIVLRDITGTMQCVAFGDTELLETAKGLSSESVLSIKGLVKEEKQAPGGYEMEIKEINVLSAADPELPIPVISKGSDDETNQFARLNYRWIDLRKPEKTQIFKAWTLFEQGMRDFYKSDNWIQLYTPSFMGTPSETGAEVFEVDYFDKKAYLAQSPQFYKQMGIASGFEKVFINGPVFRAENSFTPRHMTEFTGFDFELAYIESHTDVMDAEEKILAAGFERVKEGLPELDIKVPTIPFPRMTIAEAKDKLKAAGVESEEEHDLSPEEERKISEIVKDEQGHDFVFITDYHISKRPFYHMRHEDNPELTKSADLIYRGIEITTLAQREHRVDILEKQAVEKGMNLESLADYLNFFRYGCPPHGGGGVGPSRLFMKMLGFDNVRDTTYLPRDVKRLNP